MHYCDSSFSPPKIAPYSPSLAEIDSREYTEREESPIISTAIPMICPKCGRISSIDEQVCAHCQQPLAPTEGAPLQPTSPANQPAWTVWKRFRTGFFVLVVIGLIGHRIYTTVENNAIDKNNAAFDSVQSGNPDQAITQLKSALETAVSAETKATILMNLGYIYEARDQNDGALESFQKVIDITKPDSFDSAMAAAELADLQGKPDIAYQKFSQAYAINPDDYQLNNSLALFHLDLMDTAPQYVNYPKALTYAQKAYQLDSSDTTKKNLGIAYFFNDKYPEAIKMFSQLSTKDSGEVSLWLGMSYAATDNAPQAKIYLQKAVDAGETLPSSMKQYLEEQ